MKNIFHIVNKHMEEPPVDVETMAKDMGLNVVRRFWEDDQSGSIEKTDDGYKISVNFFHHPNKQRFTIAREIGHFMLHRAILDRSEGIVDIEPEKGSYQGNGIPDRLKEEANRFAAAVLMPTELIKRLRHKGYDTPEKMAWVLRVPEEAMKHRIQSIELVEGLKTNQPSPHSGGVHNSV